MRVIYIAPKNVKQTHRRSHCTSEKRMTSILRHVAEAFLHARQGTILISHRVIDCRMQFNVIPQDVRHTPGRGDFDYFDVSLMLPEGITRSVKLYARKDFRMNLESDEFIHCYEYAIVAVVQIVWLNVSSYYLSVSPV